MQIILDLSRKNSFLVEKLLHSICLFNNAPIIFDCYENAFLTFYGQLCFLLEKYVMGMDYFLEAKQNIMKKLLFLTLPLRVWNHMFLCKRSQYCICVCVF